MSGFPYRKGNEKESYEKFKLIEVYFKPEDVVATGVWDDAVTPENVVVTKMLIKTLKDIWSLVL